MAVSHDRNSRLQSSLNAVRHGLSGRSLFLLPDEDPAAFAVQEAKKIADQAQREAARARAFASSPPCCATAPALRASATPPVNDSFVPDGPERPLNRQQRRALTAMAP